MTLSKVWEFIVGAVAGFVGILMLRLRLSESKATRLETKNNDNEIENQVHSMPDDALNDDIRKQLSATNRKL
ncbi:MAG: hypothetical protein V4568_08320 [Pseudomonadota bacterium]